MKLQVMRGILFSLILVITGGCSSAAIKAWKTTDIQQITGAKDPGFILAYNSFILKTGKFHIKGLKEVYSDEVCQSYNNDKQLDALYQSGLINKPPTCYRTEKEVSDLVIDIGSVKEANECFLGFGCNDRYIKYVSKDGKLHAHSEMSDLPVLEGVEYSLGHIKNMIILANIQKNKDNPEWMAKMKKVCRDFKELRSTCG